MKPQILIPICLLAALPLACCAAAGPDASATNDGIILPPPFAFYFKATYDSQCRADIEDFVEKMYRFGRAPSAEAADRMVLRAAQNPDDPELLYWAYQAVGEGWTSTADASWPALLRRAANKGYPPAMGDLGFVMCAGVKRIERNADEGMRLLQKAVDNNDSYSLGLMGTIRAYGFFGQKKDLNQARGYLTRALEGGNLNAAFHLAEVYAALGNTSESDHYYEKAALAGDLTAIRTMLDMSHEGYASRHPETNDSLLFWGTYRRDPQVERMLGAKMLLNKNNEKLAGACLLFSEGLGDPLARVLAARARLGGLWGIRQQPQRAIRELQWMAAVTDASAPAKFALGDALWEGVGIPKDIKRGLTLIQESADQGFEPAQRWLRRLNAPDASTAPSTNPSGDASGARPAIDSLRLLLQFAATRLYTDIISIPADNQNLPMLPADEEAEDNDVFEDWYRMMGIPVPQSVIDRIIQRARQPDATARIRTWASLAVQGGWTNEISLDEAKQWLKQSAAQGDPIAMTEYARQLCMGYWYPKDTVTGLDLVLRARKTGEGKASELLGMAYLNGQYGVEPDAEKAVAFLTEATQRGVNSAYAMLGLHYIGQRDPSKAYEVLFEGCDRADDFSFDLMSWLVLGELGVKHEISSADERSRIFVFGALIGCVSDETLLAIDFKDNPALSRWLLRAAGNDWRARAQLAHAHVTGVYGFMQDRDRGMEELEQMVASDPSAAGVGLSRLNAGVGRAQAEWLLGCLLYYGHYVPRDLVRGRELIQRAAYDHNENAIDWLANFKR